MTKKEIKIKRIKEILHHQQLELLSPLKNLAHTARFFVFKAISQKEGICTIKYLNEIEEEEKDLINKFSNEVRFLQYLAQNKIFKKPYTQRILAFDLAEVWRIAQYLEGSKLSEEEDFYVYKKSYLGQINPTEIVDFFLTLQKINPLDLKKEIPSLPEYGLEKHQEYYRKMESAGYILANLKNKAYNFLTPSESDSLHKIYLVPWESYFKKSGVLHADLNPENILVTKDSFFLLDWENVGIGPRMVDFVNFWTRSHLDSRFQKEIFLKMQEKYIFRSEFFEDFYRTYLLSFLGIYEYYCLNKSLKKLKEKDFQQAVEFLIDTYHKAKEYL